MLVLGRKVGEKIHIGENIVITIVATAKGGVRLGFEAPVEVPIRREELLSRDSVSVTAASSGQGDHLLTESPAWVI